MCNLFHADSRRHGIFLLTFDLPQTCHARLVSQSHADRGELLAHIYFHCHPKGTGVICKDKEGIKADTFVTEYLG